MAAAAARLAAAPRATLASVQRAGRAAVGAAEGQSTAHLQVKVTQGRSAVASSEPRNSWPAGTAQPPPDNPAPLLQPPERCPSPCSVCMGAPSSLFATKPAAWAAGEVGGTLQAAACLWVVLSVLRDVGRVQEVQSGLGGCLAPAVAVAAHVAGPLSVQVYKCITALKNRDRTRSAA